MNLFNDLSQALDTSDKIKAAFKKETSSKTIESDITIIFNGLEVYVHFEFDGFDMALHPINFVGREIEICGESWLDSLNDAAISRIYDLAEKELHESAIDSASCC